MMPMSNFLAAIKVVVNEEDVAKVVTRAMAMDANLIDSLPLPKLRKVCLRADRLSCSSNACGHIGGAQEADHYVAALDGALGSRSPAQGRAGQASRACFVTLLLCDWPAVRACNLIKPFST